LNDDAGDWHEVIVQHHVKGVQNEIQDVDEQVDESLAIVLVLGFLQSIYDLLVSILIFTNDKNEIFSLLFDGGWEIFREHIINFDDKTKCYKTLDNHCKFILLVDRKNKNHLGAQR